MSAFWRRKQPDPNRFAQVAPPRVTRDASPEIVAAFSREIRTVSAILFEHDPIGIAGLEDEYDPEARTVVARLATFQGTPTLDDVTTILHEEFVAWFFEDIAGPPERYIPIAKDVRDYWLQRSEE